MSLSFYLIRQVGKPVAMKHGLEQEIKDDGGTILIISNRYIERQIEFKRHGVVSVLLTLKAVSIEANYDRSTAWLRAI